VADGEACPNPKCGQVHDPRRCTSHANIHENPDDHTSRIVGIRPCLQWRMRGLTVCRAHGGAQKVTRAKATERIEQAKVEKIVADAVVTYGLPVDVDPVEALLAEVRWTAGHVAWLRDRVQEIEQKALVWGKTKTDDNQATEFPGLNTTEQAVPNVWLTLYQAERKHLVDVCKTAIAAKIDERRVRLAEQQGEILIGAIQTILGELNLTAEQHAKVPEIVPRVLRSIAGGQAA
jgi:hypothetical protein